MASDELLEQGNPTADPRTVSWSLFVAVVKAAHQTEAECDRYRDALREIARETGTPYGETARRALDAI